MSPLVRAAWGGAVVLGFAASVALSHGVFEGRALRGRMESGREAGTLLLVISRKPSAVLGFRNLMADLTWLRAVQVSGNLEMTREDFDGLFLLLNAVANFDPRFEIPYLLGGIVLGESPHHAQEALAILERGRAQYPDDWRFHFYIGYTHYFGLGNPAEGGRAMLAAARLPGSPTYLASLASRMLSEGRDPETAIAFLSATIRQETDSARREFLGRRLRQVVAERDIQLLERAVETYRARKGGLPASLPDLVRDGLIGAVPEEPHGGSYILRPDGTVRSDVMKERLRVFQRR